MNKIIVVCLIGLVVGAIGAFAWRGGDALLVGAVVGAIAGFLGGWIWKANTGDKLTD
jgi:hypothetical protein